MEISAAVVVFMLSKIQQVDPTPIHNDGRTVTTRY